MTTLPGSQSELLKQMGVVGVPPSNPNPPSEFFWSCGDWETERDSCAALDDTLDHISGFRVYKEVPGVYTSLRPNQEHKTPRIDRVLAPTAELVALGWDLGPIGIECKKSNVKLGPAISQCIDYSRALWRISNNWVWLDWIFLWPAKCPGGTVGSILAQQRIGTAHTSPWYSLYLSSSEGKVAIFDNDGYLTGVKQRVAGRKTGSR